MTDQAPKAAVPHPGGMPSNLTLPMDRAIFTNAYAVIPASVQRDIVASYLPYWASTRAWILSRPLSGFAETFSYYLMEVAPGGGSSKPETDPQAQAVLYFTEGTGEITINGTPHGIDAGSYVYLPPQTEWSLRVGEGLTFHWIRKAYDALDDIRPPDAFVTRDSYGTIMSMPGPEDRWTTTRFVDPGDFAHDMEVNIVSIAPGAAIPFAETHVMEHGIYILEGCGLYRLNSDWVEVGPGDYLWLRAFCPQAGIATGETPMRYLLYKDVNRHADLTLR